MSSSSTYSVSPVLYDSLPEEQLVELALGHIRVSESLVEFQARVMAAVVALESRGHPVAHDLLVKAVFRARYTKETESMTTREARTHLMSSLETLRVAENESAEGEQRMEVLLALIQERDKGRSLAYLG